MLPIFLNETGTWRVEVTIERWLLVIILENTLVVKESFADNSAIPFRVTAAECTSSIR